MAFVSALIWEPSFQQPEGTNYELHSGQFKQVPTMPSTDMLPEPKERIGHSESKWTEKVEKW